MRPEEILAGTLYSEDRSGGSDGMLPIAGVILNRADQPGWWGQDIVGVCLCHGQFDGWSWADPNFKKILTVDDTDPEYALALVIARNALAGQQIERANGATHYFAKAIAGHPPDWFYRNPGIRTNTRTPCFESQHHLFFKIGLGK